MTRNALKEPFLDKEISQLDLSEEFKALAAKYGYHTLADMLRLERPYHLLKHPGFGFRMLFEFTSILRRNGLGNYLN